MHVVAKEFASIKSKQDLAKILNTNLSDLLVLGGGSNILLTKDVDALVLHINIKGIEVVSVYENNVRVRVAAGENWHEFVSWCLDKNYGGVENLSLIPGNVGTAPIQNIGAYGVELKDTFISCEAMNIQTQELRAFTKEECDFGYRNSIFKEELKGQYIITSVIFELSSHQHTIKTNYGAIESKLKNDGNRKPNNSRHFQSSYFYQKFKTPKP